MDIIYPWNYMTKKSDHTMCTGKQTDFLNITKGTHLQENDNRVWYIQYLFQIFLNKYFVYLLLKYIHTWLVTF